MNEDLNGLVWRKASASQANGDCIELAEDGDFVLMRDSKNPTGPVLRFFKREAAAFLDGAKKNEFDDMV